MDKFCLKFTLPTPRDWNSEHNFAVNLRSDTCGLTPTGTPVTLLDRAGLHNFRLPDGRLLSVDNDLRSLSIDGKKAGTLASSFGALIGEGDHTMLLCTDGPEEWLAPSGLKGPLALDGAVKLSAVSGRQTDIAVEPVKLSGSYPRGEGQLTAADCKLAAAALDASLDRAEEAVLNVGQMLQPRLMAWRMIDRRGRVMACGKPQWVEGSPSMQGAAGCSMTVTVDSGKLSISSEGRLNVTPYGVTVSVARAADQWMIDSVHRLEVLAGPPLRWWDGAYGALSSLAAGQAALTIAPKTSVALQRLVAQAERDFASTAKVVCVVNSPLQGLTVTVDPRQWLQGDSWTDCSGPVTASAAYRCGTAVVYASSTAHGSLIVASSQAPLLPMCNARVANGKIFAITSPVGGNGGWNYGRLHLLVFAADGIYAVSVSSDLRTVSSSLLHPRGVSRTDAVTVTPGCVYAVTSDGSLLQLKGGKCVELPTPFTPLAAAYCAPYGEIWLCGSSGRTATIDCHGGMTLRTDIAVKTFHPGALATDTAGRLRDMAKELPSDTLIRWHRRVTHSPVPTAVTWHIDSYNAAPLSLELLADSGGGFLPVTSASLRGQVNAPVTLRVYPPRRPHLTHIVSGKVSAATHLDKVKF